MWERLYVKYLLFLLDFIETWIFSTDVRKKSWNTKFNQNPSSGSWAGPCGQAYTTKLTVAFHIFSNAPKNYRLPIKMVHQYKKTLNECMTPISTKKKILFWTLEGLGLDQFSFASINTRWCNILVFLHAEVGTPCRTAFHGSRLWVFAF
jgi:hypothetical protein